MVGSVEENELWRLSMPFRMTLDGRVAPYASRNSFKSRLGQC